MIKRLLLPLLALGSALLLRPDEAAAQYFGRNKVQYRAFDFKIIKTEHFDVYFYPQERQAALDAARMAERIYARLSRVLQHEFRERKAIIIYASHADFQQTNTQRDFIDEGTGAFAEPLKDRVVIPFTGSYSEFEHVLGHELVHAFQFDILYGRSVATGMSPFGARMPLWFMEGMAEYLSLGRIESHTASWVRDAALAGYLRSIAEMNQRDDYLSYRFGQSLWAYIGSKWGDEVIGVLLQKAPRVGLERAFASTLGLSLQELSDEWLSEMRKTYIPQAADFQRPESFAKRLTEHERMEDPWYLAPAISPDGKLMAMVSQRDGFTPDLWLADATTGKVKRRLVEAAREADFESLRFMSSSSAFSPDGRYLAFSAQTGGRDALYIYDLQKNRIKALHFELNGINTPSWSPDGQRIVFSGLDGGLSDLFITDLNGTLQRLTDDRYADLLPSWSPDGKTIAFTTDRGKATNFDRLTYGNYRVALYHLDRNEIEVLPQQEQGKNVNPVWAPDGRSLVWVNDRDGTNNLYLFDLEQRQLFRITDVLSGVIGITSLSPVLSWSKETGALLFVYFEAAGYNIYRIEDPRTLQRVAVADVPGERPEPAAVAAADPPPIDTVAAPADSARMAGFFSSYYRQGGGFRPSDELPPDSSGGQGPVSVLALLESADLPLPDTADFKITNYSAKLTADAIGRPTIGAQVGGYYGNGIYGGSYIVLSDILGNHNLMLAGNISGSFSDAAFFAGYNFLKTRANYGIALEQVPLYGYLGTGAMQLPVDGRPQTVLADVFVRDVYRTLQGVVSYPFSTFRRVEFGFAASYMKRDYLYEGVLLPTYQPFRETDREFDYMYYQPTAAMVFDNTFFGWTGPIYGRRYRIQASRTMGDFNFSEILVDFRHYFNFKRKLVFATRLLSLTRLGTDADRRFSLFWGGPYFIRGYDGDSFSIDSDECRDSQFYGGTPSLSRCPVAEQLIGSSAAIMNLELRFPVIKELQIGFLGNFPPVDAVVFFDGGLAWDNKVCVPDSMQHFECMPGTEQDVKLVWDRKPGEDPYLVREPLFSYGFGLRLNIFYAILRFDYAFPLNRPDRSGVFSISFGPSF